MSIIDQAWLDSHPGALTQSKHVSFGRGYAAIPGSGPVGETCKTCANHTHNYNSEGRGKAWQKCALMRPFWTHGPGTDIKAKSPACKHWTPKNGNP